MTDHAAPAVVDDVEHHRFVVERDGAIAELVYRVRGDRLILVHTEVPEAFRGQGIGGALVRAAAARATLDGMVVVPWCPYARTWFQEHPEVADTLSIDWTPPPS